MEQKEVIFKVVLMGEGEVGKTCILSRMQGKTPSLQYHPTIGVEFCSIHVTVSGNPVRMQMWDAGGQQKFKSLTAAYYKSSHAVIAVFDVTRRNTLYGALKRLEDAQITTNNVPILLLANKIDLSNRQVSFEEAKDCALHRGMEYREASALTGNGITGIVQSLAERIYVSKERDLNKGN